MSLESFDKEIYELTNKEWQRQCDYLEMIASENFTLPEVMEVAGSVLTNKYAEGYPNKRYYGGCEFVDEIESLAIERCKKLFDCKFANVQPNSGSQANQGVYMALLNRGDKILGMDLSNGGHLTHGAKVNASGKIYESFSYGVELDGRINYDRVRDIAKIVRPKLIVCGASAYARVIDFAKFREIADEVGAYLFADIAHIAGLVAGGAHPSPFPHAHIVSSTTHKTLRGPRGGIIMTNIAVGSLYIFGLTRGHYDGFVDWCKQVIAICVTAFLQNSLLFAGLLTFGDHMLLGLGIMLAANEVPRIADRFGLDTSSKVNIMSTYYATQAAVRTTQAVMKAVSK